MEEIFDIVPIVAKALKPISNDGYVVQTGWYDENIDKTHVTFVELNDNTEDSSDDEEESVSHLIQVDVWSYDDIESNSIKQRVKSLLQKSGFFYEDGENLPEVKNNKKFYHRALRFTYCEDKSKEE